MRCLIATAFVLALPLAAQLPTTRDSAGVTIVENPSRLNAPYAFMLADKPSVTLIGAENKPKSQYYARRGAPAAALRLHDGRIVVVSSWREAFDARTTVTSARVRDQRPEPKAAAQIMFFDPKGKLLSVVPLSSPFQNPSTICQTRGDTLIIGDTNGKAVGVFTDKGDLVRYIGITGGTRAESCFDDGSFLIMTDFSSDGTTNQVKMVTKRTDGSLVHDFGWLPTISLAPAAPVPSLLVRGSKFYLADGKKPEIRVYSALGLLVKIIRTNDPLIPVTAAEVRQGGSQVVTLSGAAPPDKEFASNTWPAYGLAMTDPLGRLWVGDANKTWDISNNWTAFDADGKIIGRLTIPSTPDQVFWRVDAFYENEVQISVTDNNTKENRILFFPLERVNTTPH